MTDILPALTAALAGRYTLERELGQGGMATVYLAHDLRHERQVALKILRPDLAESLGAERFHREIRLVARLTHPHILPLFDSGEAGGFLYFVMPFVDGETLRHRLERGGALPIEEVQQLAREVADALDYAHRQGVVHRDVKPENILLQDGHALVADFGIGKLVTRDSDATLTQTGISVGTPLYMSPEQATGEMDIDGRSDLYSLGCVLFEALTGAPPFTGTSVQAVLAKRLTDTPPAVSEVRAGVPASLARALSLLLATARDDRCASGADLLAALRAPAVDGSGPGTVSLAVLPFANLSADPENEYFSDGITEEIIGALSRLDGIDVASRTSSFSLKGQSHDLRTVSRTLKLTHVLEGSVRRAGPRVRITAQLVDVRRDTSVWSERYDRQIDDIFAVQDEIATTIAARLRATLRGAAPTSLVTAGTTNVEAYEAYLKGRHFWNQRGAALAKAIEHFEQAVALDPGFAQPYAGIADCYSIFALYGMVSQADARARAREAAARALANASNDADVQYAAATVAYYMEWDPRAAEAGYRAALAISPRHARTHAWMAQMFGFLGRVDDARAAAGAAHDADPMSPLINAVAGSGLLFCGRYAEALPYADRALEIDPSHAVANYLRALSCVGLRRPEEALAPAQVAVATHRSAFSLGCLATAQAPVDPVAARLTLAQLTELTDAHHPRSMAVLPLVMLGDVAGAVDAAVTSLREHHWNGWASGGCVDLVAPVTRDPRWQAAMREVGLEWVVAGRLRHLGD